MYFRRYHFLICICLSPQLHLGSYWDNTSTVSLPLWPWAAQNCGDPGCDHCQFHRGVWTLPLRGRIQVCVVAADRWAVRIWTFHFPHLSPVLRFDKSQHPTGPSLLHLPLPWCSTRTAKIPALFRKGSKHPQKDGLQYQISDKHPDGQCNWT